jgi:hypothetical protein
MVPRLTDKIQEATGTKFRAPNVEEFKAAREALEAVDFEEAKTVAELWLPELTQVIEELEKETNKVLAVLKGESAHPESLMGNLTGIVSGGNSITAADAAEKACKELAALISPNSDAQKRLLHSQLKKIRYHHQ